MELTDILRKHGVRHYDGHGHHHARNGWVQLDCPFCGRDSNRFHLGYNKATGHFTCWKCGGHSFVSIMSEILRVTYGEAKKLREGITIAVVERREVVKKDLTLPKGIKPMIKQHRRYLRSREFNSKEIEQRWQVQGIQIASRLSWRLFIPIHYRGEVVSWTTRSINDKAELRYISASEEEEALPHKTLLYGEDFASTAVIVNEGPTDVWRVGPGAVGTCGTGFSRAQVNRLSKYPIRAVWFDNQTAAQQRAQELVDQLSVFPGETFNIISDSEDPGSASKKEVKQIRKAVGLS